MGLWQSRIWLSGVLLLPVFACSEDRPAEESNAPGEPVDGAWFIEVTGALDSFTHVNGSEGDFLLPEIFGSGCVLFDADQDRDIDIYLVQSGTWKDTESRTNRLFLNQGDFQFVDATKKSGLGDTGYGMGASAGDFDDDGDLDIWVSNFGPSRLYENLGDGTFKDVTDACGLGKDVDLRWWAVSSCWLDYDLDGRLDLYVGHYLNYTHETNKDCGTSVTGIRDYCSPGEFEGLPDALYRNEGKNASGQVSFRDVSESAGIRITPDPIKGLKEQTKALGVISADFTGDSWPDIYVANDQVGNLYFINQQDGTFEESGFGHGNAFSKDGVAEASMGLTAGDADEDLDQDLFMTHLDLETNTFYSNDGGQFEDTTASSQLEQPSRGKTGFGTELFDFDNDGDLDIIATNGHVLINVSLSRGEFLTYPQTDQLFENDGHGIFSELTSKEAGDYFDRMTVGRGLGVADLDSDGDLDVVISIHGQHVIVNKDKSTEVKGDEAHPVVLKNRRAQSRPSIQLTLIGDGGSTNRQAVGARATMTLSDGRKLTRTVHAGSSYGSQSAQSLHFGIGKATVESLEIVWPNQAHTKETIREGFRPGTMQRVEMGRGIVGP